MMGVHTGVQRLLGKSFSEKNFEDAKIFIKASVLLMTIGIFVSSILLLVFGDLILGSYQLDIVLVFLAILLVASTSFTRLFRGIFIASLKTKILPMVRITTGIVRIISAIILVSIGTGAIGVMMGFTSFFVLSSILLGINLIIFFKSSETKSKTKSEIKLKDAVRNTFSASFVSWIPEMIRSLGLNLGTIVVFGIQGAMLAGVYFIAFSMANAILVLTAVLLTIGFPLLSGMDDGRKKLVWRLIKMSLVFGLPITSIVMFYADEILQVFGKAYVDGSFALEILLLSILPIIVGRGIRTLVYAYGNYRKVLALGIAMNLPRIVLYFILVPEYGMSGAALGFTIGSLIGFVVSLMVAKNVGLEIFKKDLAIIFAIPTGLGFILSYYEIPFALAIILILLVSYFSYLKIGIIKREDLNDSIMILPKKISGPTLKVLNKIAAKMNSSY